MIELSYGLVVLWGLLCETLPSDFQKAVSREILQKNFVFLFHKKGGGLQDSVSVVPSPSGT